MAKNTNETQRRTRRTEVKDLPREEKELSKDEQKKVQGGVPRAAFWVGCADKDGNSPAT